MTMHGDGKCPKIQLHGRTYIIWYNMIVFVSLTFLAILIEHVDESSSSAGRRKIISSYRSKGIHQGRVFFDTINGYLGFSIQMVFCKTLSALLYFLSIALPVRTAYLIYEICWLSYTAPSISVICFSRAPSGSRRNKRTFRMKKKKTVNIFIYIYFGDEG